MECDEQTVSEEIEASFLKLLLRKFPKDSNVVISSGLRNGYILIFGTNSLNLIHNMLLALSNLVYLRNVNKEKINTLKKYQSKRQNSRK